MAAVVRTINYPEVRAVRKDMVNKCSYVGPLTKQKCDKLCVKERCARHNPAELEKRRVYARYRKSLLKSQS